jgi:hypothetical protein
MSLHDYSEKECEHGSVGQLELFEYDGRNAACSECQQQRDDEEFQNALKRND